MKYIVFWVITSWVISYWFGRNDFGFFDYKEIKEKFDPITLSKEFSTRDSALDFIKRLKEYKPKNDIHFVDTVWITGRYVNETGDAKFENFKEEIGFHYTEQFWNWISDCSDATNQQPYYNKITRAYYDKGISAEKTAHYIERLYRMCYNDCIDSVGGKDIWMPKDSSEFCFSKVFGKDFKK
jgi:hypothetical protein